MSSYCPHPRTEQRNIGVLQGYTHLLCAWCGEDFWKALPEPVAQTA